MRAFWILDFGFWIGELRSLKALRPRFKIDESLIQNPKSKIQNGFCLANGVRYGELAGARDV
jgi:hypothetical protein